MRLVLSQACFNNLLDYYIQPERITFANKAVSDLRKVLFHVLYNIKNFIHEFV